MSIVVTGGAGFIGSHCVRALLQRGERVLVMDDLNDYYDPEIKKSNLADFFRNANFRFFQADIRDRRAVDGIFAEERPERLVHLAARAGVRPSLADPELYYDVNVRGTSVVLEAAARHGVSRAVLASSSSVYGERERGKGSSESDLLGPACSPYAASKQAMEDVAAEWSGRSGLAAACLRFFTVYGPGQRPDMAVHKFVRAAERGETITAYGDGESCRDYTYIDDTLAGIFSALDRANGYRVYNLGSGAGRSVTLSELIAAVEKATGKTLRVNWAPRQPGDVNATLADVGRARAELDYEPQTQLDEGIKKFVEWYRLRDSKS